MALSAESATFQLRLEFIESAVADTFGSRLFAQTVHGILTKHGYSDTTEITDDLENANDSFILHCAAKQSDIHNLKWVLLRIFLDGITDLNLLRQRRSVPRILSKCSADHVSVLARIECLGIIGLDASAMATLFKRNGLSGLKMKLMKAVCFQQLALAQRIDPPKARKIWKAMQAYAKSDIDSFVRGGQQDSMWTGDEEKVSECTAAQILFIAQQVIPDNAKTQPHQDALLSFLRKRQMDGKAICECKRRAFSADVVAHANNKKVKGPAAKLLNLIKDFDVASVARVEYCC